MIERTFLHLPGVGANTERRLWNAGLSCWDDLWRALHEGRSPSDLIHRFRQRELFPLREHRPADPKALAWLDCLDQSRVSLRQGQYRFLLELLKPEHHWRLLDSLLREALYLDIETTGLSRDHHYITLVGALYEGTFYQWVWPEPLDELADLVRSARLVVTFNGRRFDLPFLAAKARAVPPPNAHIDLRHVARAAGLTGGQKAIERELGLRRDADISDLDGLAAVGAWCSALYGERDSFARLLRYNRADVEMMPELARILCSRLTRSTEGMPGDSESPAPPSVLLVRRPASFASVRRAWRERRPALAALRPSLVRRFGREPVVVGIDLRAKDKRPTGWAMCQGPRVHTEILYDDETILRATLAGRPDLVSIDAPLFLPRGRESVSDDSPCRQRGGIVRDAERILWSRGVPVYPALIKQMQGLTRRGIDLMRRLQSHGLRVIESYPGAAQDILNIPRKGFDQELLRRGLAQFGYQLRGPKTHDELDAVTSALVGQFYLANQFEALGATDEGFMIVPKWSGMAWGIEPGAGQQRTVSVVGLPGSGKTTLTRALAQRLGWRSFILGDALRDVARRDVKLRELLARGEMAPEPLVCDLIREAAEGTRDSGLLIDGFPRHREQVRLAQELFPEWTVLFLQVDPTTATRRLNERLICGHCGFTISRATQPTDPCPSCRKIEWRRRTEDSAATVRRRLRESNRQIKTMLADLRDVEVIRVTASHSADTLADKAIDELMSARID